MTAILDLNAYHGDAAAALVVNGELLTAAKEERFDRSITPPASPSLAAAEHAQRNFDPKIDAQRVEAVYDRLPGVRAGEQR